jgi:hypothetical protein
VNIEKFLEIKKGLEVLFANEGRELFWFGASAYKISQPDNLRRKRGTLYQGKGGDGEGTPQKD